MVALFSGELIFGGALRAYYWKEFCVSEWVGFYKKIIA